MEKGKEEEEEEEEENTKNIEALCERLKIYFFRKSTYFGNKN